VQKHWKEKTHKKSSHWAACFIYGLFHCFGRGAIVFFANPKIGQHFFRIKRLNYTMTMLADNRAHFQSRFGCLHPPDSSLIQQ
jgi:hypothetical protein